jgi:hypothetical protein
MTSNRQTPSHERTVIETPCKRVDKKLSRVRGERENGHPFFDVYFLDRVECAGFVAKRGMVSWPSYWYFAPFLRHLFTGFLDG